MSYQSAHDPRLHFGLWLNVGSGERRSSNWPSGIVDRIGPVRADQMMRDFTEGSSKAEAGTMDCGGAHPDDLAVTGRAEADTALQHREQGLTAMREGRSAPRAVVRISNRPFGSIRPTQFRNDGLGVLLAQQGHVGAATRHFRAAVEARAGIRGSAVSSRAGARSIGGWVNEAIPQYYRAVQYQPDFIQARYLLAGACQKKGDVDGAEWLLRDVVSRAPGFAEARHNLGLLLQAKQDPAGAVEQLRAASGLEPHNTRTLLALGIALAQRQQDSESAAVLGRPGNSIHPIRKPITTWP